MKNVFYAVGVALLFIVGGCNSESDNSMVVHTQTQVVWRSDAELIHKRIGKMLPHAKMIVVADGGATAYHDADIETTRTLLELFSDQRPIGVTSKPPVLVEGPIPEPPATVEKEVINWEMKGQAMAEHGVGVDELAQFLNTLEGEGVEDQVYVKATGVKVPVSTLAIVGSRKMKKLPLVILGEVVE